MRAKDTSAPSPVEPRDSSSSACRVSGLEHLAASHSREGESTSCEQEQRSRLWHRGWRRRNIGNRVVEGVAESCRFADQGRAAARIQTRYLNIQYPGGRIGSRQSKRAGGTDIGKAAQRFIYGSYRTPEPEGCR